jgi:hypothetical protein
VAVATAYSRAVENRLPTANIAGGQRHERLLPNPSREPHLGLVRPEEHGAFLMARIETVARLHHPLGHELEELLADNGGLEHSDEVVMGSINAILARRPDDLLSEIARLFPLATDDEKDAFLRQKMELKEEMKTSPSQKVKDALVLNLLVRIDLLNQQLHKLEKEYKKDNLQEPKKESV